MGLFPVGKDPLGLPTSQQDSCTTGQGCLLGLLSALLETQAIIPYQNE